MGSPRVAGSLDAEIVRRIVRRHLNELRFCYEQGLTRSPDLAGQVTLRWTIGPTGNVTDATVASSTLGSPSVASCMAGAVRRWSFPSPRGGGVAAVTFPLSMERG